MCKESHGTWNKQSMGGRILFKRSEEDTGHLLNCWWRQWESICMDMTNKGFYLGRLTQKEDATSNEGE